MCEGDKKIVTRQRFSKHVILVMDDNNMEKAFSISPVSSYVKRTTEMDRRVSVD
jgi:hypothetical protein